MAFVSHRAAPGTSLGKGSWCEPLIWFQTSGGMAPSFSCFLYIGNMQKILLKNKHTMVPLLFYKKSVNYFRRAFGSDSKESSYNAGDVGSIPRSGRSPGEEHGNPLHYSCLRNPMDRGDCRLQPLGSKRVRHD